jgi:hypothetical protein
MTKLSFVGRVVRRLSAALALFDADSHTEFLDVVAQAVVVMTFGEVHHQIGHGVGDRVQFVLERLIAACLAVLQ